MRSSPARPRFIRREACTSTIRFNAQVLNRGQPSMESELWEVNSQVLNGSLSPEQAAARLQAGFAGWYAPQRQQHGRSD